jgi:hypothetical protein
MIDYSMRLMMVPWLGNRIIIEIRGKEFIPCQVISGYSQPGDAS